MRRAAALIGVLAAGCGGGAEHAKAPCPSTKKDPTNARTCAYAHDGVRARVTTDDLPQAWRRWQRAQVERTQAAMEWSRTPSQRPRDVPHVGAGAFWIAATRELVASDGQRMIVVRVRKPAAQRAARAAAIALARQGLGPNRVPVNTGP